MIAADLTDIFQVKFDTGSTPVSEFYVDNLVFTAPYVAHIGVSSTHVFITMRLFTQNRLESDD